MKVYKLLDILLSPPKNYSSFTYKDQLKQIFNKRLIFNPKKMFRFIVLGYMIGMSYLLFPIAIILQKIGYRFVDIDLDQIGSVFYLDVLIREDKITQKTKPEKTLVLFPYCEFGNRYLLDLYKEHVTFIKNPFLKFLLSPFFVSDVFMMDSSYRYDLVHHGESVSHRVWQKYTKEHGRPLIKMPFPDVEKAKSSLSGFVPIDRPFVALHARDMGFYNISSQNTRNVDIFTYRSAIKYLISRGFVVIRLGDKNMVDVAPLLKECGNMLFDYAHSPIKSEMMDIYLLSHCAFMIGCTSGPSMVPPLFHINCVLTGWLNVSNALFFMKDDITTFKKFRYKKDNKLVPFGRLFEPPFSLNPSQKDLDERGIFLEENTEQEILDTVVEFLENKSHHVSERQKRAKEYIMPENYAWGAMGNFSNTILKEYF